MTLYVRELVDEFGVPLSLYRESSQLTAGAAVPSLVSLSAAAECTRTASASVDTTATITASASVSSATDISSLLVAGAGTYNPGSLTVPGYDQAYKVTATDALLGAYSPGVAVMLPTPSTPDSAHTLSITYTVSDTSRRFYHEPHAYPFTFGDGLVVEPSATVGDVATLNYSWSTSEHRWSVSSYTGSVSVRDHGPGNAATYGLPMFFSPELRADGSWATIEAAHIRAMEAIPFDTRADLANAGGIVDVSTRTGTAMFQCLAHRGIFNPVSFSGTTGRATGRYAAAVASNIANPDDIDAKTMLHEIGHLMDVYWLTENGMPNGYNPRTESPTPFIEYYYFPAPNEATVQFRVYYDGEGGNLYKHEELNLAGSVIDTVTYPGAFGTPGRLTAEEDILAIWESVENPSIYYRKTVGEWIPQACMAFWCARISGFSATTERDLVISYDLGGTTAYNAFVAYMQEIGAFPT